MVVVVVVVDLDDDAAVDDAASSRESATTNAIVRLYGSASRRLAAQQRRSRRLRAFQNPECAPEISRRGMQNDVARGLQNPFLSTKSKGKSEASEERLEARLDVVPGEASGA